MHIFESKKSVREHLVALTKELVRFPSHVQEPLKIFDLIEFIKSYFDGDKVNISTHVYGGLPSLVITFEETKHPHILLSGHIDVVPSSTKYTAEESDGKLYGSGTMDMKGGVACMMALMKFFSREKNPPSLGIMLTSDEEVGSSDGTMPLLEHEGYRANFVIVNEGRDTYDIVVREKGALTIKFSFTGVFGHSAYPWTVSNVLEELMKNLLEIKKIFPRASDRWMPTASITMVNGGREINTIPGYAEATMNIRLTGGKWSRDEVVNKIKKKLAKGVEMSELMYGDIFLQDPKLEHVQFLKKAAEKVLGRRMKFGENHGASDARIFMKHRIPVAILGPSGKHHHTPNEFVEIENLVEHFEVLKTFIEEEQERVEKPM